MVASYEVKSRKCCCGLCVRSCGLFTKVLKLIPVCVLAFLIFGSYYVYVVEFCFKIVPSAFEKTFYLIGYHIALFMLVWSYYQCIVTRLGTIPPEFKLSKEDFESILQGNQLLYEKVASSIPVTNRTRWGHLRYCESCHQVKPDRAHHCSVCGTCVLKMDHHCPWINNCASFTNYKFFVLFMAYAIVYCNYIVFTSLHYFLLFTNGDLELPMTQRFYLFALFTGSLLLALGILGLFCFHCYLVVKNKSTLELFLPIRFGNIVAKNAYNLGASKNFREVFGDNRWLWFLPIHTSLGNGVVYPVPSHHQLGQYYNVV